MLSIEPVERSSSDEDLVAGGEQRFRQVRADEPGAAGDQSTHAVVGPSALDGPTRWRPATRGARVWRR